MKTFAASLGALVLVAGVLVGAAPASAALNVFTNPAATAQNDNLDILGIAVDYTNDAFLFGAYTENFVPGNGYSFTVNVTPAQRPLNEQPYYLTLTGTFTPGSMVVYETLTYGAEKLGPTAVPGAVLTYDPVEKVVSLSVPPLGLISSTTIFAWASLSNDAGGNATAGIPAAGNQYIGFGPINIAAVSTVAGLRLSSPSQVYGSTPAVALISVGPPTARGRVAVMDGATELVAGDYLGSDLALNLPAKLSLGKHALTAVFTPFDAKLYSPATSTPVTVESLSPGTKTSTAVKLSKSTQHYKKSRVKVTINVSHKPSGKVVLYDGTKKLKTLTLKKGKVSYTLSKSLKKGSHKLKAVFVPKNPLSYAPSTSTVKTLKVVK